MPSMENISYVPLTTGTISGVLYKSVHFQSFHYIQIGKYSTERLIPLFNPLNNPLSYHFGTLIPYGTGLSFLLWRHPLANNGQTSAMHYISKVLSCWRHAGLCGSY